MDPQEIKIFIAILVACIVLTILIIYFAISLIGHQRRSLELNRKTVLQEIAILEKDRARMAADLHDELGPLLSQIKFRVNSLEVSDPDDQEQLEKSSTQLDEAIERVRGIARDIMPGNLLKKGLHTAIKEFVDGLNYNGKTRIRYENESNYVFEQEKSINIYRAIQEICQNTLRHANAQDLLIRFTNTGNRIQILCEDNGSGFDYEALILENRGLGLRNLRSRIEIIGGKVQVTSVPGKGTQYVFDIPVDGSPAPASTAQYQL